MRVTDGRTYGQTDGITVAYTRYSMLSRINTMIFSVLMHLQSILSGLKVYGLSLHTMNDKGKLIPATDWHGGPQAHQ